MDSSQGTESAGKRVMRCESENGPILSSGFWYQLLSKEMIKVVVLSGFVFAPSQAPMFCLLCFFLDMGVCNSISTPFVVKCVT